MDDHGESDMIHVATRRLARAMFVESHHAKILSHPNLCIGSGGVMGYLLLGALEGLFSHLGPAQACATSRKWIQGLRGFSGVSVGSLVAACLACRVDLHKFKRVVTTLPVAEIIKKDVTHNFAGVMRGNVPGVFEGDSLIYISCLLLKRACGNGAITFREITDRFGSDLRVLAVRVHDNFEMVFSATTTPDIPVAAALAASMSIPGMFNPAIIDGVMYVDGGVRNQTGAGLFPVHSTLHVTPRFRGEYVENPRIGLSVLKSLMRVLAANYISQVSSQFSQYTDHVLLVDSETKAEISTVSGAMLNLEPRKINEMLKHGFEDVKGWTTCFWCLFFVATCCSNRSAPAFAHVSTSPSGFAHARAQTRARCNLLLPILLAKHTSDHRQDHMQQEQEQEQEQKGE